MDSAIQFFPEQASTMAWRVDALYTFLIAITLFFTTLICVLILAFIVKYRHGSKANRENPPTSVLLEITWSVIPLVITMIIFGWGAWLYLDMNRPPKDCLEITVVGKQWMWKLQQPNGRAEINELHVPTGRPVRLKMISEDVIHSFYVPAFRVKMDVLPDRYTSLWFEPIKPGEYHLFCAEYCGTSHSQMIGRVVVQEPAEYADWLAGGASHQTPEQAGEQLFTQFRCGTCHTAGADGRGPPLGGLLDSHVTLSNGGGLTADAAYIRESIFNPGAKVVAGYQPIMPSFQGQIGEEGIFQLIAYLKSLPRTVSPAAVQELKTPMPVTQP